VSELIEIKEVVEVGTKKPQPISSKEKKPQPVSVKSKPLQIIEEE
jgi:hypothetical protein